MDKSLTQEQLAQYRAAFAADLAKNVAMRRSSTRLNSSH